MKKKPIKPDSGIKDVYEEYTVTTRQWNGDWSVQKRLSGGRKVIDIKDIPKYKVLQALHKSARAQDMGFLHYDPDGIPDEQAKELVEKHSYFDYLQGRVMKVDISKDELDPVLYDRDNGPGAAARAIAAIKED